MSHKYFTNSRFTQHNLLFQTPCVWVYIGNNIYGVHRFEVNNLFNFAPPHSSTLELTVRWYTTFSLLIIGNSLWNIQVWDRLKTKTKRQLLDDTADHTLCQFSWRLIRLEPIQWKAYQRISLHDQSWSISDLHSWFWKPKILVPAVVREIFLILIATK